MGTIEELSSMSPDTSNTIASLASSSTIAIGFLYVLIQTSGAAIMVVLQRQTAKLENPFLLCFWGDLWNVFYWLPPGLFTWCRFPILWPDTPEDGSGEDWSKFPLSLWAAMIGSGVLGSTCMVCAGMCVGNYLPASTYSLAVSPLSLIASIGSDVWLYGRELSETCAIGMGIILIGYIVDAAMYSRGKPGAVQVQGH